jgi:Protein of unknown function (DUF1353).
MDKIRFKDGYKYQLNEDYSIKIPIYPHEAITTPFINLYEDGRLIIFKGYAWDGPSGPTIDTPSFMRGSLVHDALYQLMRESHLDHHIHREMADKILVTICLKDGMLPLRAKMVYQAVRLFADPASSPNNNKQVKEAP